MDTIPASRKPNNLLRQQRELRGWSQKRVVEELDRLFDKVGASAKDIGRWERGIRVPGPFYREKLCILFNCDAAQLGFLEPPPTVGVPLAHISEQVSPRGTSSFISRNDEMNIKRRKLLHLLSIASSTLILPIHVEVDWERVGRVLANPPLMDAAVLQDFAAINQHYWHIFRASSQKRAILDGVLGQLDTLIQFLTDTRSTQQHRQLCILVSDLSQLTGEIFFDMNQYDAAQSCYAFAANAAKEAKHYDLWGCALIRHAFLPIYDQQFHDALPLLQGAERLAYRGDTALVTRYWVAAVSAESQAGIGNLALCQRFLDQAEEVHSSKGGSNGTWLRFDGTRLPEQRGTCFVHLKRPDLALPSLQEALRQLPILSRRRGLALIDLATASFQQREIEQACTHANEAVSIAAQGASGVIKKGIYTLRKQLEPFAETDAVRRLDQHLSLIP